MTIAALSGDNGILKNAGKAKEETEKSEDIEKIKLAVIEAQIGENGYQELTTDNLGSALIKDGTKAIVSDNEDETKHILFLDNRKEYKLDNNGNIEDLNIDFNKKYVAPSSQDEIRNEGVIGIGKDGNPVDMDLWSYSYDTKTEGYLLNSGDVLNNEENGGNNSTKITKAGYLGTIEAGKISGSIPMYIKKNNEDWIPVTSLYKTFQGNAENNNELKDLIYAPSIPNTVKNMMTTFSYTNIENMPIIPDGVTNMTSCFYECRNLIETSIIPGSVQTMDYCFNNCTSLVKTPQISYGVINLNNTFNGCSKLVNVIKLPDSIKYMEATFRNCILLENMTELPSNVENLSSTFDGCTSLKNGPSKIPYSVENMVCTFVGCSNLQGSMEINANIKKDALWDDKHTYYYMCFSGATIKDDIKLTIKGNCEAINEIILTKE